MGIEYGCGKRGGIAPNVDRNIGDFLDDRRRGVLTLYDLPVVQEAMFCEYFGKPCLLTMERHINDIERCQGEDQCEECRAEIHLLRLSLEKGGREAIDPAKGADDGSVARCRKPIRRIAEIDAIELNDENGQKQEQTPSEKVRKERHTVLGGQHTEEKYEAQ